jgi:hypothetical protein
VCSRTGFTLSKDSPAASRIRKQLAIEDRMLSFREEGADHLPTGRNQADRLESVHIHEFWEAFPRSTNRAILEWIVGGGKRSGPFTTDREDGRRSRRRSGSRWGHVAKAPPT